MSWPAGRRRGRTRRARRTAAPASAAPDRRDCCSAGVPSSASTKLRTVVPSRPQCSTLMPARAVGEDDEGHRLVEPAVAAVAVQQVVAGVEGVLRARSPPGRRRTAPSRRRPAPPRCRGRAARRACRLSAHSARALVVRCPRGRCPARAGLHDRAQARLELVQGVRAHRPGRARPSGTGCRGRTPRCAGRRTGPATRRCRGADGVLLGAGDAGAWRTGTCSAPSTAAARAARPAGSAPRPAAACSRARRR